MDFNELSKHDEYLIRFEHPNMGSYYRIEKPWMCAELFIGQNFMVNYFIN